jgi:hypothetical protein
VVVCGVWSTNTAHGKDRATENGLMHLMNFNSNVCSRAPQDPQAYLQSYFPGCLVPCADQCARNLRVPELPPLIESSLLHHHALQAMPPAMPICQMLGRHRLTHSAATTTAARHPRRCAPGSVRSPTHSSSSSSQQLRQRTPQARQAQGSSCSALGHQAAAGMAWLDAAAPAQSGASGEWTVLLTCAAMFGAAYGCGMLPAALPANSQRLTSSVSVAVARSPGWPHARACL